MDTGVKEDEKAVQTKNGGSKDAVPLLAETGAINCWRYREHFAKIRTKFAAILNNLRNAIVNVAELEKIKMEHGIKKTSPTMQHV